MAGSTICADLTDNPEREIFCGDTLTKRAGDVNQHRFRTALWEALRGENVFDFRCADAERQRAKCAMGAGMAVTTDDRHTRLSKA